LDTRIVLTARGLPAVLIRAVYLYYCVRWNSTAIAEELGIKSPQIRVWLWRLNRVANGERGSAVVSRRYRLKNLQPACTWSPESLQRLFLLKAQGKNFKECAVALGVSTATASRMWRASYGDLKVGKIPSPVEPRPSRKPRPPRWSPDKLKILFAMRTTGKSTKECAAAFQVHHGTIVRTWHRHFGNLNMKLKRVPNGPRKKPVFSEPRAGRTVWPPERIAKLKALWEQGTSWEEIRSELGLNTVNAARTALFNRFGSTRRSPLAGTAHVAAR
jgi:transposase-like protein